MFRFVTLKFLIIFVIFYVVVLTAFFGSSIGLYFTICHIVKNFSTCIVEEYTNRGCYESHAQIIMEQYFKIDANRTGFYLCGPVLNCLTSPCSKNIIVGASYKCLLHSNNLYWLDSYNDDKARFIILSIFLCILSLASLIIFIFISVLIYKHNISQTYNKVDDSDVENINMGVLETNI